MLCKIDHRSSLFHHECYFFSWQLSFAIPVKKFFPCAYMNNVCAKFCNRIARWNIWKQSINCNLIFFFLWFEESINIIVRFYVCRLYNGLICNWNLNCQQPTCIVDCNRFFLMRLFKREITTFNFDLWWPYSTKLCSNSAKRFKDNFKTSFKMLCKYLINCHIFRNIFRV